MLAAVKDKPSRARQCASLTAARHVGIEAKRPGRKDGSAGAEQKDGREGRQFRGSAVTHSVQRGGPNFRALTGKALTPADQKGVSQKIGERLTLDFFVKKKFDHPAVRAALARYGTEVPFKKIIVAWEWESDVPNKAATHDIELWDFRKLVLDIVRLRGRSGSDDDMVRALNLCWTALMSL